MFLTCVGRRDACIKRGLVLCVRFALFFLNTRAVVELEAWLYCGQIEMQFILQL